MPNELTTSQKLYLFGATGFTLGAGITALTAYLLDPDDNELTLKPFDNLLMAAITAQGIISLVSASLFAASGKSGNEKPSNDLVENLLSEEGLKIKELQYQFKNESYFLTLHQTEKDSNTFFLRARRIDQPLDQAIGDYDNTTNYIDLGSDEGYNTIELSGIEQWFGDEKGLAKSQVDVENSSNTLDGAVNGEDSLLTSLLKEVDEASTFNPVFGDN